MQIIDFILHFDEYLGGIVQAYGTLTYFILFAMIFCETGLVVTPFLPGDSMIFVAATFAAMGSLNVFVLWAILSAAAVLGDSVNYFFGATFGRKFKIKKEYLEKTENFYAKYGKKTIIYARFIPIVRTFAPFVAGTAKMDYKTFLSYNILGGILWVSIFTLSGYFFGGFSFVQENLHYIILGIIAASFVPPVWEYFKEKRRKNAFDKP